jgi:hypothetical protein
MPEFGVSVPTPWLPTGNTRLCVADFCREAAGSVVEAAGSDVLFELLLLLLLPAVVLLSCLDRLRDNDEESLSFPVPIVGRDEGRVFLLEW